LSGTGIIPPTAPAITLSATSLIFGNQLIGTTSATQTVTLTNTGNATLTITSITASGDFAQTNNCGTSVAAGAGCAISVTFTPATAGQRTGGVTISSNASGSPPVITLTGTGVSPGLALSATVLAFPSQAVGTTSVPQTVTVTNTGSTTLAISGVAASGDFAQSNNCGSLSSGASCVISITFTPTAAGNRVGSVTITSNSTSSPNVITLTGTGAAPVAPAPAVSLSTLGLTFQGQVVGTTSAPQPVTLTNIGNATLTISSIAPSGDFAQSNNCGSSVAAGASCTISITFTPTTTGTRAGVVKITDNASGSPHMVTLSGAGLPPGPAVSLSSTSLTFGSQDVGIASAPQSVTLTNTGTAPLTISSITVSGDFALASGTTCANGSMLAAATAGTPAGSCSITITFVPAAAGIRKGAITITDNAPGSPHSIALTGTGMDVVVSFPSGSSASATVTAGQAATYQVSFAPSGGFSDTVTATCTGAPVGATCTPSPAVFVLNAPTTLTVTVTTLGGTGAGLEPVSRQLPPASLPIPLMAWLLCLLATALLVAILARGRRTALASMVLSLVLLGVLLTSACAQGNPVPAPVNTSLRTPAGTYPLMVTVSTLRGFSRSVTLTLVVR